MKIMKFKKIYTLGLGLLIAGMSAVNAQTQDNEKIFYRIQLKIFGVFCIGLCTNGGGCRNFEDDHGRSGQTDGKCRAVISPDHV